MNYRDSRGRWHAIDDRLTSAAAPGYAFQNRADRYRVSFPASLGARPIRVATGSGAVAFRLLGAKGHARANGRSATFANTLPGVTASYTAKPDAVKEDLTLAGPSAPSTFSYALTLTRGLRARQNGSGGIDIVDRRARVRFSFDAPFAYDRAGARIDNGRQLSLHLTRRAGGRVGMRLAIDRAWLAAAGRKYPVVIDPGVNVSDNQDCYIMGGSGANTSYCGGSSLKVGWDGTQAYRSLLRFDVAGAVPANSAISGAHLFVYLNGHTTTNATGVSAQQVTHSWTTGATWNKFDGTNAWTAAGGDFQATAEYTNPSAWGYPSVGTSYAFGISNLVQKWLDGATPNYGVLLKEPTENVNNVLSYTSASPPSSNAPYVQVDWEPKFMGDQPWYPMAAKTQLSDRQSIAVNAAGGNLVAKSTDLQVAGIGLPFSVKRTLNGQSPDMDSWGYGWSINGGYDMWLSQYSDAQTFYDASGTPFRFTKNTDGSYTAPAGIDATLKTNGDGTNTITYDKSGTQLNFDDDGDRLNTIKDNNGHTLTLAYNADDTVNTVTDTEGRVTTFAYDTGSWHPRINKITDSSGRYESYTYYPSGGPLKTFTDGAGNITTYSYDGSGDLTQIVDGAGNITCLTYDGSYRVTSIKRITDNTTLAGDTTTFTYNSGNTVVTDPLGNNTTYYFDSAGRQTKVVDGKGNTQTQTYNSDNQPVDYASPKNQSPANPEHNVWDSKNNQTDNTAPGNTVGGTTVGGAHSSASFATSGAHPNFPDSATNAQGTTQNFTYDSPTAAAPNLQSISQSVGGTSTTLNSFTYDSTYKGQINSSTDINGNQTTYHYDANHVLDKITPPSPQGVTTLGHDSLGRVSTVQDGLLQTTTYSYDGDDRVKRIDYPDSSYVTFTYDGDGNATQVYDSNGALTETYNYDRKNRLTSDSGATGSDTYTYDAADNRKTLTDGGGTVTYAYDAANNVCWAYVGSSSNGCGTVPTGATWFEYDSDNNRTHTHYPGSVDMSQSWDNGDRLSEIKAINTSGPTTLTDFKYDYTAGGTDKDRRSSVLDVKTNNLTKYTYETDRGWLAEALTNASGGTGSQVADYKFKYDPNGNLIHRTDSSGTSWTTLGYDNTNELCWKVAGNLTDTGGKQPCTPTPTGATTFSYDADGQQTAQSGRGSLTWSKRHQPTSVFSTTMGYFGSNATRIADGADTFKYNAAGLGTKTTSGTSAYYTRDPDGTLLSDRTSASTYNYIFDGLGSVVALTNSSGAVSKTYSYDPYGTVTAGSGTVDNPWQYAGGYWDSAAGVEKFGQRYYDPSIARWSQPDPIDATGIQQGNRYLYGSDDPVDNTDRGGTRPASEAGAYDEGYETTWARTHGDPADTEPGPVGRCIRGATVGNAVGTGIKSVLLLVGKGVIEKLSGYGALAECIRDAANL